MGATSNALQGGQVLAKFRGVSPAERDRLLSATWDNAIRVEESPWTLNLMVVFNTTNKPFEDVRVRQALSMSIDRLGARAALSKISTLDRVGGIMRPGSEFATRAGDLALNSGFGSDIKESRGKARKLLAEAGVPYLRFKLTNRTIAQPYTAAGIFLIDQWRQIGVTVEQVTQETSAYTSKMNNGDFEVATDFGNFYSDEPNQALAKYVSYDRSPENRSRAIDRELDALFDRQRGEMDPVARAKTLRDFETRALTQAYQTPLLWWRRIVLTSPIVKGWIMSPSHTLGQDLAGVWLDQSAGVLTKTSTTGPTK